MAIFGGSTRSAVDGFLAAKPIAWPFQWSFWASSAAHGAQRPADLRQGAAIRIPGLRLQQVWIEHQLQLARRVGLTLKLLELKELGIHDQLRPV